MLGDADEIVQQFYAANPEILKALVSFAQAKVEKEIRLVLKNKHARDAHIRLIKLVGDSKLDLNNTSDMPQSTVETAKCIIDARYEIPLDLPLPLLWPADNTIKGSPAAMCSAAFHNGGTDSDGSFSANDLSCDDDPVNDLIHRMTVSMRGDFTYPPELFGRAPSTSEAAAGRAPPRWSYGTLYRMDYPDPTATDDARATLEQMDVKLPQIVLDLGRLVVNSDQKRPGGTTWSPSDFAVMVDMESKARSVWLLCDSHFVGDLRSHNESDGMADDLDLVRNIFDSSTMDLALLFPRIEDWTTAGNTWATLRDRISKTAMKLGLRLRHL